MNSFNFDSIRLKIAFLISISALLFNFWFMFQQHQNTIIDFDTFLSENKGKNYISIYESRFEEIRKYVQKPTRFFYIAEENTTQYRSPTEAYHYVMSQYHFAPNILYYQEQDKNCCDKILYNKYNTGTIEASNPYLQSGWVVEKDFKNGLIILSKP